MTQKKMTTNNNTIRILIFASMSMFIGALLYGGGFYVVKEKVQNASLVVRDLNQAKNVRDDIELVNQNITNTQKDRARIKSFFVNSKNVIPFIEKIEALGSKAGVETTLSDLNKQNNNELVFSLKTKGSFKDTMLFTALLENLPFNITFNKAYFSITPNTEEGAAILWEGNFTAVLKSFDNNAI